MEGKASETVKRILGSQNVRRISLLKKTVSIHNARLLRAFSGGTTNVKTLPQRTFVFPKAHLFFGYYDVSQFGDDENLLLAVAAPPINRTPPAGSIVRLGFFDIREKTPEFHEFGRTATWCWQQGCRLQWYPLGGTNSVIYNTFLEGQYRSVVQDIRSSRINKVLPRPIYTVNHDGKWGLSLNFSRLQRLRPGYGYNALPDESAGEAAPAADGIWRFDMETGEEKLLFSIRDIAEFKTQKRFTGAQHYFNHILFNTAGNRFMFFHICQLSDGRRKIRLLTSNIDGADIHLLNDSGHASHYCWQDNDHLLCYSTVAGKGEGYFLYDDRSGESQLVGAGTLNEDGHPSYLPGGQRLITDTYPDKYGEMFLLLYDFENNGLAFLHKEYMPLRFNTETRCDFHPRVSPSGKQVCIDCIVDGKRTMKVFDISSVTANSH